MNKRTRQTAARVLFWLMLFVIMVYLVFPFYWALNSSLKTEAELQRTPATFLPQQPSLENYLAIFQNDRFVRGLMNSLIVASCTTIICLFVGAFGAFALGKLRFRGKTVSLYIILAMTMFPGVAVLSGLYSVVTTLRIHPIPAMILSYMIFTLPFTMWVLTSFFKDLPIEIMRSAEVDGASTFQTFYMILLPLTVPALVTTGLLAFIAAWNEYLFALTFTTIDPSSRTVPVAIALFTGEVAHQEPFGQIMAAAIVVTIPLVILVLIFQQKIVAGLTAGAVKG
jgi:trehalose/maltose transport system permease protein